MDELNALRIFIQVVDEGSLSATARRNHLAVSSIARQLKTLEDALGTRLLNKTTRQQSLTEAGALFYKKAKHIVSELDRAKRDISSFQQSVKGLLKVYLRTSAACAVILPALADFLTRNPQLTLDVTLGDERIDLIANGIDVAIFLGHLEDSSMVARRISPSQRVVCASPDYFKRHSPPLTPQALTQHNCLIYQADQYGELWHFTREKEKIDVPVAGNLHTSSAPTLLAAALSGLGLMVVQKWMVSKAIQDGQLQSVLTDYQVSPTVHDTALYAVYPHSRGLSPKARVFVDFVIELFRQQERR
jgi:DNA-binding transcriptional LysR family regulator